MSVHCFPCTRLRIEVQCSGCILSSLFDEKNISELLECLDVAGCADLNALKRRLELVPPSLRLEWFRVNRTASFLTPLPDNLGLCYPCWVAAPHLKCKQCSLTHLFNKENMDIFEILLLSHRGDINSFKEEFGRPNISHSDLLKKIISLWAQDGSSFNGEGFTSTKKKAANGTVSPFLWFMKWFKSPFFWLSNVIRSAFSIFVAAAGPNATGGRGAPPLALALATNATAPGPNATAPGPVATAPGPVATAPGSNATAGLRALALALARGGNSMFVVADGTNATTPGLNATAGLGAPPAMARRGNSMFVVTDPTNATTAGLGAPALTLALPGNLDRAPLAVVPLTAVPLGDDEIVFLDAGSTLENSTSSSNSDSEYFPECYIDVESLPRRRSPRLARARARQ